MRQFLFLTFFIAFVGIKKSYAQFEFNLGYIVPSGKFAYLIKPAPSFELAGNIGEMDSYYRLSLSIGYMPLKTTQDTFKTYATGGSPLALFPGYTVIKNYSEIPIGLRNEVAILGKKTISPIIGFDVYFNVIGCDMDHGAATIINASETGNTYWNAAILPRIGLQYKLSDHWLLTAGVGRSMSFIGIVDAQSYWKTYVGIKYFRY